MNEFIYVIYDNKTFNVIDIFNLERDCINAYNKFRHDSRYNISAISRKYLRKIYSLYVETTGNDDIDCNEWIELAVHIKFQIERRLMNG